MYTHVIRCTVVEPLELTRVPLDDKTLCSFYAARDPIGVTCAYVGWGADGSIWMSNEMKALKV
jgi:hypothetical protein